MSFDIHLFPDLSFTKNSITLTLKGTSYEKFNQISFTEEKEQRLTLLCYTNGIFSHSKKSGTRDALMSWFCGMQILTKLTFTEQEQPARHCCIS